MILSWKKHCAWIDLRPKDICSGSYSAHPATSVRRKLIKTHLTCPRFKWIVKLFQPGAFCQRYLKNASAGKKCYLGHTKLLEDQASCNEWEGEFQVTWEVEEWNKELTCDTFKLCKHVHGISNGNGWDWGRSRKTPNKFRAWNLFVVRLFIWSGNICHSPKTPHNPAFLLQMAQVKHSPQHYRHLGSVQAFNLKFLFHRGYLCFHASAQI